MTNAPVKNGHHFRCSKCLNLITDIGKSCQHCGTPLDSAQKKSLLGRIKSLLGIELSSDFISLDIEEPESFLSEQEIEMLLETENITVLDLEDVPNRDSMFYKSRRVRKPLRRDKS